MADVLRARRGTVEGLHPRHEGGDVRAPVLLDEPAREPVDRRQPAVHQRAKPPELQHTGAQQPPPLRACTRAPAGSSATGRRPAPGRRRPPRPPAEPCARTEASAIRLVSQRSARSCTDEARVWVIEPSPDPPAVDDLVEHVEAALEEGPRGGRLVLVAHALGPLQARRVPPGPAEHLVPGEDVPEDLGSLLDPRATQGTVEAPHPRRLDEVVALPAHDRAGGEVGAGLRERAQQVGVRRGRQHVVGVEEGEVVAAHLQGAEVAGRAEPAVDRVHDADPVVAARPAVGDLAGPVGRPVVDDHRLPAGVRLGEEGADAVVEVVLHAPGGDDHAEEGSPREEPLHGPRA